MCLPQGDSRRAEVTAARLIDDIGWSTPMAPTRSAAAAATLDSPRDAPAGQATGSISMSQLHWLPSQSPSEWPDLDWSLRQPLSGQVPSCMSKHPAAAHATLQDMDAGV